LGSKRDTYTDVGGGGDVGLVNAEEETDGEAVSRLVVASLDMSSLLFLELLLKMFLKTIVVACFVV
jgi:hypothetical protein